MTNGAPGPILRGKVNSLRFRTEDRRNTEIAIAVRILNHMLDLGRPDSVRVA